jgi:hypothetical protein
VLPPLAIVCNCSSFGEATRRSPEIQTLQLLVAGR